MICSALADGICTLTIDRPERANALTRAMLEDLESAVARAEADETRVLVIAGAGRLFSAGADLGEAQAGLATDPIWERLSGRIAALPCLTIAALPGTAAGGALGMVLACDLRIAAREADIFYPVMRLGFLPQPSDPARLTALVGPARAKMLLMGGARIDAMEALAWGLVDRVVARAGLAEAVDAVSADARSASGAHVAALKRFWTG